MEHAFTSRREHGASPKLHPRARVFKTRVNGQQVYVRIAMYKFVITALIAVVAFGCGSSSSGSSVAAFQVSYQTSHAAYYQGVPIKPNAPALLGTAERFEISPPLPIGLSFDTKTGVISGKPEGLAPTRRYTVTSFAQAAIAETDLEIGIVNPPRFAFVANKADSTISAYSINPETGSLRHDGYLPTLDAATGPADLVLHPSGDFFFTVNRDNGTITSYGIDEDTGTITQLSTAGVGTTADQMVLDPAGRFLYVTSIDSNLLRTYVFDSVTGGLAQVEGSTETAPEVADLAIQPSGRFLSMTNRTDGLIQTFSLDQFTGIPTLANTTVVNSIASSLTFSDDGLFAYVTAESFQLLIRYRVDPQTGLLFDPRTKPTGTTPQAVTVHPSGRFVYVVNSGSDTLTNYRINSRNGIPRLPTIVSTGAAPQSITFDPGGNFAYVMNANSADLSVYRVNLEDGSLRVEESMRARVEPRAMVMTQGPLPVSDSPQFVYIANEESGDIGSFTANSETGELVEIGLAPLTGDTPKAIIADPLGRFVYVANEGSSDISSFSLNEITGALTEIGARIPSGLGTNDLAIEPSGRFLFATARESGTVSSFSIDQATGLLTFLQTEPATNPNPVSVATDPTGRFLYVVSLGIEGDQNFPGSVAVFRINPHTGLIALQPAKGVTGGMPTSISFSRTGSIAYVSLQSSQAFLSAKVDAQSGSLTADLPLPAPESRTLTVAVTPAGRVAYSAVLDTDSGERRIETLMLLADGTVTPIATTLMGASPTALCVGPAGNVLYAINPDSDDVSVFSINRAGGALTFGGRTQTGLTPSAITVVGNLK